MGVLALRQCQSRWTAAAGLAPPPIATRSARLPVVGFDLDNTLWDTVATLRAAHAAMLSAAPGLPEAQRSHAGWKEEVMATMAERPHLAHDFTFLRRRTLERLLGSERDAEEAYTAWFAARNSPRFFAGAVEAVQTLRGQGFRLCAITDGNSQPTEIPELAGAFEFSVSSVEAGAPKPDSRPFLLAAERAGVPCSAMVYVGDNYEKDVLGAQAVGMRAVWVRVPTPVDPDFALVASALPDGPSVADAEVDALEDLPAALASLL